MSSENESRHSPKGLKNKLTEKNWSSFEDELFDLLNHYGKAGQELREGELITSNKPYRSDVVNEERMDVTTNTVNIVQRPWNDKTDEQDYQRDMAIYSKEEAQYLKDKANLWIFIISNLTASVHSRIKVKLS